MCPYFLDVVVSSWWWALSKRGNKRSQSKRCIVHPLGNNHWAGGGITSKMWQLSLNKLCLHSTINIYTTICSIKFTDRREQGWCTQAGQAMQWRCHKSIKDTSGNARIHKSQIHKSQIKQWTNPKFDKSVNFFNASKVKSDITQNQLIWPISQVLRQWRTN